MVRVHDRVAAPRRISQRFTGNAAAPATRRDGQAAFVSPASIAPGISSMIALSTISMIVIEIVSAASATGIAAPRASPPRTSGTIVSE